MELFPKPTIAVFDFDGTITTRDTLLEFIKFSKGKRSFITGFLLFSPLLIAMKLKLYPNWRAKQLLFSYFYKGISIKQFNEWGDAFSSEIDKMVRLKALNSLRHHNENGDNVIIISASVENWIRPWANKNGIQTILATTIEINEKGLITGKFSKKNCYGKEKVNRLVEKFPRIEDYKVVSYGDSRGDKELIEFSDEGYYNKFV